MGIFFVDPVNGLDANNGLGPDASASTNKPWKTIGKLLGAAGMAAGDTAYLSPGKYREQVTVGFSPGSAVTVVGDPGNTQGFKTSGGVLVAPGECEWTNYNTNDTTAPTATALLTMSSKSNFAFSNILFVAGAGSAAIVITNGSANSFTDCAIIVSTGSSGVRAVDWTLPVDTNSGCSLNRCIIVGSNSSPVSITLPTSASADYSSGFAMTNCVVFGGQSTCVLITSSGASSFKGGGVAIKNCDLLYATSNGVQVNVATISTSQPVTVDNCLLYACGVGLNANAAGQIVETYCRIVCPTARTNVTAGTGSIAGNTHAVLVEVGQSLYAGRAVRPFLTPTLTSPLLAFGALTSPPTVDLTGRDKPSGAGPTWASANGAAGALERHDFAVKETTTVDVSPSLKVAGPGDVELLVPVPASSTTLTIKVQRDGSYGGGTKPTVDLVANGEIGVAAQSVADAGSASAWNTVTLAAFTPSAAGVIRLRLRSFSAGAGKVYWDTAGVPTLSGSAGTAGFDYFLRGEPFPALTHDAAAGGGGGGGGKVLRSSIIEGLGVLS